MNSGSRRFIKNATSNVISGGASAIIAVVLPYYFVRLFRPTEFSLWVLVLQLAAYVNFFTFGVQVAIGRFVTFALERNRHDEAEDFLNSGLQVLAVLAIVSLVLIIAVALLFPVIFTKVHPAMVGTARAILLWIGGALALGVPFSAFPGVFIGLQRNDIPAVLALISKGALVVAVVMVARHTHDLVSVARTYFVVCAAGYVLQLVSFRTLCNDWKVRPFVCAPVARKELIAYCASVSVWTISMLMVRGLDTTIVGIFDFRNVASYGVSAGLITLLFGFVSSVVAPLLQVFTKDHAKGNVRNLLGRLERCSYLISVVLLAGSCWTVLVAKPVFHFWVGARVAALGVPIFVILTFANSLRNSAAPYAVSLLATGQHSKVYIGPLSEGITNLVSSIALAAAFGAIGVAWGTMIGATVGVLVNYLYNLRRTMPPWFSIRAFWGSNIGLPLLIASPMAILLVIALHFSVRLYFSGPLMLAASVPSALSAWRAYRAVTQAPSPAQT